MNKTDMPGDDYSVKHHPKGTPASVCQGLCDADTKCEVCERDNCVHKR